MSGQVVERRILPAIRAAMQASPVVAITGPRTVGKSTLAAELVASTGGTAVDLDDPAVRRLAREDPSVFVRGLAEPVVIDEFQRAPDLLAVIKAELNRDRRPGRFILAGSARHDAVPELADYLTGRVELLQLWPFAQAELVSPSTTFPDRLFSGIPPARRLRGTPRDELVADVVRGGYPIAVELSDAASSRWFANLARLVVERVSDDVTPVRGAGTLTRFLRLAAASTAQTRNAAELGRDVDLGRDQAAAYLRLLELVYLTFTIPAWSANLTSKVTKRPKLHLVDSGLAAHLQGLTVDGLRPTDPVGAARFGPLLETFVVTEVVKQLGWSEVDAEPFHYRTTDGVEVDLVLEARDGRVAAIEVKAGSMLTAAATRGLVHLRDRLGDRFVGGVLLNTGNQAQQVADRISLAPVDELWAG
ncbi:MAG: ATP-binding protein [Dermatophilaceae bacterium]